MSAEAPGAATAEAGGLWMDAQKHNMSRLAGAACDLVPTEARDGWCQRVTRLVLIRHPVTSNWSVPRTSFRVIDMVSRMTKAVCFGYLRQFTEVAGALHLLSTE